ncbi:2OG-Fe(II) oxygenase [Psychrobacter lutiphocae]|uniref:2OG-Fe(II) oxygenase n=1 Tax=Psychrobacter lutiphocae TaxID=540500 RepID=UPI0003605D06|nr:2OG-Fe(II) oxygenase [Psychrobacter lutiphocae]
MTKVIHTAVTRHLIEDTLSQNNAIDSNTTPTLSSPKDPISVAIPPPLIPSILDLAKKKAKLVLQQLPPDTSFSLVDEKKHSLTITINPSQTQQILQASDFKVSWTDIVDDKRLDDLVNSGFIVLDNVYSPTALLALQAESGFVEYRDAKLAQGIRKADIRGDRIRWITQDFFAGFYYLQSINQLAQLFNRTLFAAIRHSEAHYACYPPGFGYQWHTDNPAGRDERVISAVFYLNDDWKPDDGGELSLIDNHDQLHKLTPKANRLVLFNSNLKHQVEIAHRQRYSIATWLRHDDVVLSADP